MKRGVLMLAVLVTIGCNGASPTAPTAPPVVTPPTPPPSSGGGAPPQTFTAAPVCTPSLPPNPRTYVRADTINIRIIPTLPGIDAAQSPAGGASGVWELAVHWTDPASVLSFVVIDMDDLQRVDNPTPIVRSVRTGPTTIMACWELLRNSGGYRAHIQLERGGEQFIQIAWKIPTFG